MINTATARGSSKSRHSDVRGVRCAIYTRKSTEEGLEQEFNTLDAQRESGEAYIASQRHEGWELVPTRYDDGGFSGGTLERPALKRLMADVEAGKVDCIVTYKLDRLSRSLLDFTRLMEVFDRHQVGFVSVTQAFCTNTSTGRLMLHILLSFAQFEREIISERTRDKVAAARRKGKYIGGAPILGYDLNRDTSKLVVNAREAAQVKRMFDLYLEHEALLPVVAELDRLGWTTKRWTTHAGKSKGGHPFDKNKLHGLLTNVCYIGQVKYRDEAYAGEHAGIIAPETFERVQEILNRNYRNGGAQVRNKFGALLKGLLHCAPCGCAMVPAHTTKGTKVYRYYTCGRAQKKGWANCPSKSVPAAEIEQFVVDQIRGLGNNPDLIRETLAEVQRQRESVSQALRDEQRGIERSMKQDAGELRTLARSPDLSTGQLADLHERTERNRRRLAEIEAELEDDPATDVTLVDVQRALVAFDPVWDQLSPAEKAQLLRLLVEGVDYDGAAGTISVRFHPEAYQVLAQQIGAEGDAA